MNTPNSQNKAYLRVQGCTKQFSGLIAVHNVNLEVSRGEMVGLIGPNGAGKTTLLNLVAGTLPVTRGEIILGDTIVTGMKAHQRVKVGIGRTFQIPKPFAAMTVYENVEIAALFGSGNKIPLRKLNEKVDEVLEKTGMVKQSRRVVTELNLGERKRLELAKALATQPTLLLLDEVMAGLNPRQALDVIKIIRQVHESGVTVILVEHIMRITMEISQRIVVMHHGEKIAEGVPKEIIRDPAVVEAYFGLRYASRFI
jgi:branched-chain amino acid transport system ATP-binding protein